MSRLLTRLSWMLTAWFLLLILVTDSNAVNLQKYESCGPDMECTPRTLCQEYSTQSGEIIIAPRIANTECPPLYRCCSVEHIMESKFI